MSKVNNRNLQQYTLVQRSLLRRSNGAKSRNAGQQSNARSDSWRLIRRGLFAAILSSTWISTADAQVNQKQPPSQTKQPPAQTKQPGSTVRKMSEQEKKVERARSLYADAANAQNNGAYSVAIELWNKLIAEHPDQPLVSSARYFLGVCYQEQENPDYPKAIAAFRKALEDSNLKEREESLNNLG
ncbi:MAG: tetratricopeptide repeat protein, partial [Pirellula sp.]